VAEAALYPCRGTAEAVPPHDIKTPALPTQAKGRLEWGTRRLQTYRINGGQRFAGILPPVGRQDDAVLLGCCFGVAFRVAEDVAEAANLRSNAAELFFDVLVAAVHVVDAVEDGFAVGDHGGENQRG
jgi:hypothetical protein